MKIQLFTTITLGAVLLMLACSKGESDLVGTWTAEFTMVEADLEKWMADNDVTREEIEDQLHLSRSAGMMLDLKADGTSTMIFGPGAVQGHWKLKDNELTLTTDNAKPGTEDLTLVVSTDFSTITASQELSPGKTIFTRN